jgi:hypothetical protein
MRECALIGLTIMFYQADAHVISKVLAGISHLCIKVQETS